MFRRGEKLRIVLAMLSFVAASPCLGKTETPKDPLSLPLNSTNPAPTPGQLQELPVVMPTDVKTIAPEALKELVQDPNKLKQLTPEQQILVLGEESRRRSFGLQQG